MKRILIIAGLIALPLGSLNFSHALIAQEGSTLSTTQPTGRVAEIEAYVVDVDKFVKGSLRTERIFANVAPGTNPTGVQWREFKTEDERKKADTGDNLNESAFVWLRDGKVVGANFTFQSPSRDWSQFAMYYFRADGTIAKSDSTLNASNGGITVVRQDFYDSQGMILKGTTHCKDLKTQLPKPCGDFQEKPAPFYRAVSALPFYQLLKK